MGKKKQKNKQKQKQKQKKITQRQQKRTQRKQEQKQKRQQTAQQKRAEHQRLFEAKQIERQKKNLKPQRRKKSENRQQLEKRFKELTDKANRILDKFDYDERMYVFDDDYGALFYDKTIMTQKGRFRTNASELSIKELEERNKILDTFITDAPEYEADAEAFEDYADNVFSYSGLNDKNFGSEYAPKRTLTDEQKANRENLWAFMGFVRAITGNSLSSEDYENVLHSAKSRFSRGDNWEQIRDAFYNTWMNSPDIDTFNDNFNEQGVLIQ